MNIVSSFMDADHAYLDKLLAMFLSEQKNPGQARKLFQNLRGHLLVHIELENDFLFPRFDQFIGIELGSGPTAIAIRDHDEIIKLLEIVEEAFLINDTEKILESSKWLHQALKKHRSRENKIHYPVSDHFVKPEEWQEVIKKFYGAKLNNLL